MRYSRRWLLPLVGTFALLGPAPAWADDDDDDKKRGDKKDDDKDDKKREPAPVRQPVIPASQAPSLISRQGAERMVSDPVQLVGVDGSGAGPLRLDVEGARPNSVYEVMYVPASNPTIGVVLGNVRTDAAGTFKGGAPEELPAIGAPGRTGVVVFRRLAGA